MARLSNYVIDTEITDENQNMLVRGLHRSNRHYRP